MKGKILKKLSLALSVVITTVAILGLAGCPQVPEHEHTFATAWTSNETHHWHAATCEHMEEETGKEPHSFGEWSEGKRVCSVCEYEQVCEHTWDEGVVTTEASCGADGVKTFTCTVCLIEKTEEIAKLPHTWDAGVVTTAPTCLTKGIKTYNCTVCGNVQTEEIPELYSSPIDVVTGLAATASSTNVYFGVFPKTVLPSYSTITVDETDSVTMGANSYYKGSDGEYYAKVLENAGLTSAEYKYKNGEQAKQKSAGSYRYFKVEPIKWKVLTTDYNGTGNALLLAEDILTANVHYYYYEYNSYSNKRTVGMDKDIYPNNYKYSQIRAYLNGLDYYYDESSTSTVKKTDYTGKGFLQTAFTETAQSKIVTTTVDNSAASTTDAENNISQATSYACENTSDKIFLLSEKEVTTTAYGFTAYNSYGAGNARIRMPTDYAMANYAWQSSTTGYGGYWWLRSPGYNYCYSARHVTYDGDPYPSTDVISANGGVVPALSISF